MTPEIKINDHKLTDRQASLVRDLVALAAAVESAAELFKPISALMAEPKVDEPNFWISFLAWVIVLTGVIAWGILPVLIFLRVFRFI